VQYTLCGNNLSLEFKRVYVEETHFIFYSGERWSILEVRFVKLCTLQYVDVFSFEVLSCGILIMLRNQLF